MKTDRKRDSEGEGMRMPIEYIQFHINNKTFVGSRKVIHFHINIIE